MLRFVFTCLLLAGTLHTLPATAETTNCTTIDSLPVSISTQGVYCLRHNLSTSITSGIAIAIRTNNVTIDCNDWKIGGLAGGIGTEAYGIVAAGRNNVTIRNCGVRGFRTGIWLHGSDSGYHLVENNRLDNNTYAGIRTRGDNITIRGNRVYDTGGSTIHAHAYGIDAWDNTDIIDNTVSGVVATAGQNGEAFGIVTSGNLGGEVSRNRVSGISPDGGANKRGIWANGGRPTIRNNSLINHVPNVSGDSGIVCNNSAPVARDNIVIGFGTPGASVRNCISSGNTVNL